MEHEIERILNLESIKTVFQPIVSLRDGYILGHEVLSRITVSSTVPSISALFELAERHGKLWRLEQLCRTKALEAAHQKLGTAYDKKLFINVHPSVINDSAFYEGFTKEYLQRYALTPANIVFEISERGTIADTPAFQRIVQHYRDQHYKITIDDVGAGYSGLNLISSVAPDFIKIDMQLIRGIHKDKLKYAIVKSLIELSHLTSIGLIGEGIECYEELEVLINMGLQYGQGYFLQKPCEKPEPLSQEILAFIKDINRRKNHTVGSRIDHVYIENIATPAITIPPDTPVLKVQQILKTNPELSGLYIVEQGMIQGIITRAALTAKLSEQYGFSLYQNKPISTLIDQHILAVDHQTPISIVSQMAMARSSGNLYDMVAITKNSRYYGIVTVKDLLERTTEMEIINAKNLNPLSGLPGNRIIEERIELCIQNHPDPYTVMYIDIDNFKAYNDVYGFENGDLVIKLLADVLRDAVPDTGFIGHIGGDDFVAILNASCGQAIAETIISNFCQQARAYYTPEDVARGYITAKNRKAVVENFPLVTLSIAATGNHAQSFQHSRILTEKLAAIKSRCKLKKGNCCICE